LLYNRINTTSGGLGLLTAAQPNTAEYLNLDDEQVILLIRHGDKNATDFLIHKYRNLVKLKSRAYFLIGADREDVIQEGMIGLYKAIRNYQPDKAMAFKTFAELCITRQMITAVKNATRQKHIPLNSYISLNRKIFDEESDKSYIELVPEDVSTNPEQLIIKKEEFSGIENKMWKILSPFEWMVLSLYLNGKSYVEIARKVKKPIKSIDNALQRVKKKVEKYVFVNKSL